MNEVRVKTPEGVLFSFSVASPITRFLAWSVDAGVISILSWMIGMCLRLLVFVNHDIGSAATVISYFVISVGYGIMLEWHWRGQTLGKRLLRLRVMDEQGLRLRFNQIVIRNLLRAVNALPILYFLGGVACLISSRSQRLGDLAANTIVVRSPRILEPDLDQLAAGKFNSLRQYPHLEARLRQRLSPVEAAVLLQALLRRDDFDAAARVELFSELATHCRTLVHFPAESADSLADEQYVRNVVDIIFQ